MQGNEILVLSPDENLRDAKGSVVLAETAL
jgi:hypothetical protein